VPEYAGQDPTGLEREPLEEQEAAPVKRSLVDHPVTVAAVMGLALPTLIEQLLSAAIGFMDTWVAGHTVMPGHSGTPDDARAASAAAVGAMTYLQWFVGLMTSTLAVGATAIVARSIGARRPRIANRVAGTSYAAAFLVGIGIALLLYACAWPLAWAFSLQGDGAAYAVAYLRIMCWTVCFQTAALVGMACLRGAGDTLRPMLITIATTLINCIASPALTFGWFGLPALGVRGNAMGTLLAFGVAGIATFGFLVYGDAGLKLRLGHLRIVPHLLARVSKIGVPSWLEGMMLWGGQLAVVMLVMGAVDKAIGRAGSGITMAAHNATLRIESMAFLPGYGFGIAAAALVGQYLGARKPEEAQRAAVLCGRLAMLTMVVAAIPMVFFPKVLLHFMVESREVVELGWVPLIIAGLAQPAFAVAIAKSQALKGAGDTVSPLKATIIGMGGRVVVVLGIMFVLVKTGHQAWGLTCVWVCIFLDLLFRGVVMEVVFRRGRWKERRV
jgi:putative MATE family efflux protein